MRGISFFIFLCPAHCPFLHTARRHRRFAFALSHGMLSLSMQRCQNKAPTRESLLL